MSEEKKYTQADMDAAITNAFEAAREKDQNFVIGQTVYFDGDKVPFFKLLYHSAANYLQLIKSHK